MGIPGGSVIKNPPANAGDMVRSLGREDPLEKGMATHFSILAWEIPSTEEPRVLQSMCCKESDATKCAREHMCICTNTHTQTHTLGQHE